ncbi:poly(R)-hydroxyalkanoic acid synthase subunit PhaE [Spiribacter halobius]|uniref:Poly(3-hydroxyalkanoate) polymerase subunit PhaE n=1 Tax=Sediminicurvatus halobius TaxID=2182432 RepID=A0A2U2MW12_9GAMM|nr:poly(R)-hydroxyalkanoic acid synthase subunit PhaE [Spiribacter halobius]PWG61043.1 hypothetical protein DEM34_18500 [Spiribacter halobius]UEX78655.1 hypothetical protein LMH63_03140 [Spiribacter halobius]
MTAQSGERLGSWAEMLEALWPNTADPLGVWRLFEDSAEALRAGDGQSAAERVEAALAAARERQDAGAETLHTGVARWLEAMEALAQASPLGREGLPPLGPGGARSERYARLPVQLQAYRSALATYLDRVTVLTGECVGAYRRALDEAPPDADALTLARLWCDTAEPRYERWLAEDATQSAMAALVNRWSELTGTLRSITDDGLEALGLPSARGLDDLAAELQRQRRRHRRDITALREEIHALRREMAGEPPGQ